MHFEISTMWTGVLIAMLILYYQYHSGWDQYYWTCILKLLWTRDEIALKESYCQYTFTHDSNIISFISNNNNNNNTHTHEHTHTHTERERERERERENFSTLASSHTIPTIYPPQFSITGLWKFPQESERETYTQTHMYMFCKKREIISLYTLSLTTALALSDCRTLFKFTWAAPSNTFWDLSWSLSHTST